MPPLWTLLKGDYNIDDVKKLNQFHFYDEADEAADRASLLPPELRSVIYRGTSTSIKKAVESVPIKKLLDTYSSAPRWAKRDPKLAAAVVMQSKLITHIDATARTHKDFIEAVNMGIFIQVDYEFDFFTFSPAFIQYKNNHGEKKARFLNDVEELAPSKLPFRDEFIEIRDEMDVQALVDLSVRYINIPEGDEISHKYGISKDVFWLTITIAVQNMLAMRALGCDTIFSWIYISTTFCSLACHTSCKSKSLSLCSLLMSTFTLRLTTFPTDLTMNPFLFPLKHGEPQLSTIGMC